MYPPMGQDRYVYVYVPRQIQIKRGFIGSWLNDGESRVQYYHDDLESHIYN